MPVGLAPFAGSCDCCVREAWGQDLSTAVARGRAHGPQRRLVGQAPRGSGRLLRFGGRAAHGGRGAGARAASRVRCGRDVASPAAARNYIHIDLLKLKPRGPMQCYRNRVVHDSRELSDVLHNV